ncbi:oxidoreductase [Niallia circulans]|uniref:Oxidoreductase n=1 Tax=Niallia circulans TaxID=1397 RepID=A0A0J1IHX4_NIACI|nr:NAD(P)/FAD-dependent oxidoreductase [Niallia circulans]KLV25537.1 oxidoreductase [Niallia circulans]HEO8420403.1 NAD(P)-binding domain-containing protein [Yersinia enterocolitica]
MKIDTLVIGAGQAGISIGYYLKKMRKNFLILDKGLEIGETWKSRYDSLVLFTPRMYSSLPGLEMEGEQHGFPTKDEVADYLKKYTETFQIPIKHKTEVTSVTKQEEGFIVNTKNETYISRNIVVATGPFHSPSIPSIAENLPTNIQQIHSSEYINSNQLIDGNVLVVGGGNSGAQIAVELSEERETYLAHSDKLNYLPLVFKSKSIFWWFDKLGILNASNTSRLGKFIQKKGDPIFGYDLKHAIKQKKIIPKERVIDVKHDLIIFKDLSTLKVNNIVWATGFKSSLSWLEITNLYDKEGKIIHHRGVTKIKGLFFIGLPWQYRRGSALLQGVGYDAEYIVNQITKSRSAF